MPIRREGAWLDEYDDVIRGDERYSPYKYDALEGELEELLDREFEAGAQGGRSTSALLPDGSASPPAVLSWTPKLDALSGRSRRRSTRCSGGG